MKRQEVYLDNNATTQVDKRVVEYMNRFHLKNYAVASSQFSHTPGIQAKDAVEQSREIIAHTLNADTNEIIFTSGDAESNNLALKGLVESDLPHGRNKIIVSGIEHFSVLNTAKMLKKKGYSVDFIKVDSEGFVDINHFKDILDESTLVVSVMHGNHEVGTIQNITELADLAHQFGAYFHTDATYSFMQVPIDVKKLGIDLLTISADKIHGPKGIGVLFIKRGTPLEKQINGGYQEFNFRGGSENVPGIAGFGKACELYDFNATKRVEMLKERLYTGLTDKIDSVMLNGPSDFTKRLPNNLNLSFAYVEGESVVLHLDMRGIAVITGSACFSRSLHASHVLLSMGFSHERAHGSIRFGLSKYTTVADIDYTVKNVQEVIQYLRRLSPLIKTT